jgi:peptidoglycan/xylan/chitin deacetylase (PgdA/CDA1 family)
MKNPVSLFAISILFASCTAKMAENTGHTVITKWQGDKRAAISITYDDGSINQFKVAVPIMNKLGIPGTFFINTGKVNGSAKGKFIGRPREVIIKETASIKTNPDNFFERASLIRFTGIDKAVDYHTRAGSLFESGKVKEAYELMDEAYAKVRSKGFKNKAVIAEYAEEPTTWEDFKTYTAQGHEIAAHTITHPKLAVLDETNLLYELEQCKADIEKNLGKKYTFSAECPYGTENERVMEYAHKIFPALRNRMPESYLDELNRSSKKQPGESKNEYVQWQRGPVRKISMEVMKSYIDTCLKHDNIWLVLVFHGVDGIGYEPRTGAELDEYFSYIKDKEPYVWVATFGDVTKYMRERKNSAVKSEVRGDSIAVNVSSGLDPEVYDVPVTLKTYVPKSWKAVVLHSKTGQESQVSLQIQKDAQGFYVLYPFKPGEGEIVLTKQTGI